MLLWPLFLLPSLGFWANLLWPREQPILLVSSENHTWNEALADTFYLRFSEEIKDRLSIVDLPLSFEALVEFAIQINKRLAEQE